MKITRILRDRRAVSPILAAILLIGLAVAAGAVLFVVVLPMIQSQGGGIVVDEGSLIFTDSDANKTYDKVTLSIKNEGTKDAVIKEIWIQWDEVLGSGDPWADIGKVNGTWTDYTVKAGQAVTKTFSFDSAGMDGMYFRVKVVYQIGDADPDTIFSIAKLDIANT